MITDKEVDDFPQVRVSCRRARQKGAYAVLCPLKDVATVPDVPGTRGTVAQEGDESRQLCSRHGSVPSTDGTAQHGGRTIRQW